MDESNEEQQTKEGVPMNDLKIVPLLFHKKRISEPHGTADTSAHSKRSIFQIWNDFGGKLFARDRQIGEGMIA